MTHTWRGFGGLFYVAGCDTCGWTVAAGDLAAAEAKGATHEAAGL